MKTPSQSRRCHLRLILSAALCYGSAIPVLSQRALHQLESWAGYSINSVNVPSPSAPGGSGNYRVPFSKTPEQKANEAADHYDKAVKAMNGRNWEDAIRLLKKAMRKAPYNTTYSDKLRTAEAALDKERQANKAYQERLKREAEEQKRREEEKRRIEAERLEALRREQEAYKEKIDEAARTIKVFKQDIKTAQLAIRNLSRALQNNSGEINKWSDEMDRSMNTIMENAVPFIGSIYIKYCFVDFLRPEVKKEILGKLSSLFGSSNPSVQKWLAAEMRAQNLDAGKVQDWVDRFNLGTDAAAYVKDIWTGKTKDIKLNLEGLLFLHGVLEACKFTKYETLVNKGYLLGITELPKPGMNSIPRMPGDYFELAKIIGVSYTNLAVIGYSWKMVKETGGDSEYLYGQVQTLAAGIEQRQREIECLEKCVKKYSDGCLEACTGKTSLSKPPPPLLFQNSNW